MTRFRHKATGVLVTVSDERAGSLTGSDWERADQPVEAEKPAPAPRRRRRKTNSGD